MNKDMSGLKQKRHKKNTQCSQLTRDKIRTYTIKSLTGPAMIPYIPDLARLRITVFREFPYLYEGDLEYETDYLDVYTRCHESLAVIVWCDRSVVGASTGLPLEHAESAFREPFLKAGLSPERIFYFGESVLLKDHRGQGFYRQFFDLREAYARSLGCFRQTAFCAVERPSSHPLKPAGYIPLDRYWEKRGYTQRPDLITRYPWKDLGDHEETLKSMIFWVRNLN